MVCKSALLKFPQILPADLSNQKDKITGEIWVTSVWREDDDIHILTHNPQVKKVQVSAPFVTKRPRSVM